jgi:hypothetical protein
MYKHGESEWGKTDWVLKNSMESLQKTDFEEYRKFWGDEFRWTSFLPFAWKMLDYPWLEFPEADQHENLDHSTKGDLAIGIWSTTLHLLGPGMGWINIRKGLEEWGKVHYRNGFHPILDFVKKMCGDSIEHLSMHVANWNDYYLDSLSELNLTGSYLKERPPSRDEREPDTRTWPWLAQKLIDGGTDPLHLSHHFTSSVIGDDEFFRDFKLERLSEERFILKLPRYAQWALQLKNCGAQSFDEGGQVNDAYVDVRITNLGSIGTFATFAGPAVGNETWFRYSEEYDESPESQIASHAWGL